MAGGRGGDDDVLIMNISILLGIDSTFMMSYSNRCQVVGRRCGWLVVVVVVVVVVLVVVVAVAAMVMAMVMATMVVVVAVAAAAAAMVVVVVW